MTRFHFYLFCFSLSLLSGIWCGERSSSLLSSKELLLEKGKNSRSTEEKVSLILYSRSSCPYCQKVLSALQKLGKTIEIRDISNAKFKKELKIVGGKVQVPCLLIDGRPLYESQDIINWLKENITRY